MSTFVIQTLGGKDAVLEAGSVVVSLLDVHVVVAYVVGDSENVFVSPLKLFFYLNFHAKTRVQTVHENYIEVSFIYGRV